MALRAETLVEEWLKRKGCFSIRGLKRGLGELDLLAVRPQPDDVVGWHVEVTVSFRPSGYLAREPARSSGQGESHVRKRTPEEVRAYARQSVESKSHAAAKFRLRAELRPGVRWSFHLIP